MNNDVIADMFTIIRNGLSENHDKVYINYSKLKYKVCQILLDSGYLEYFDVEGQSIAKKKLVVRLKYNKNGKPLISSIRKISKSSKRIYLKKTEIPKVLNGFGLSIFSTSKGIMSGHQARLKNVGGEYLGEIW